MIKQLMFVQYEWIWKIWRKCLTCTVRRLPRIAAVCSRHNAFLKYFIFTQTNKQPTDRCKLTFFCFMSWNLTGTVKISIPIKFSCLAHVEALRRLQNILWSHFRVSWEWIWEKWLWVPNPRRKCKPV